MLRHMRPMVPALRGSDPGADTRGMATDTGKKGHRDVEDHGSKIPKRAYEKELAAKGKQLLEDLYTKYLDRSYTTSIWTELVEP